MPVDREDESWLLENARLRLDATSPLFPGSRRRFHLDRYRFAAAHCRGAKVLDVACGTGYGSALLGEVAREVTGGDLFTDAVEYARRHHHLPNVTFVQAPVELLPFPARSFDRVVSFETLEHTLCPTTTLAELSRVLRDDGIAILSVPNRWGETPNHFHDFDTSSLRRGLDGHFEDHELHYQNSGDWRNRTPPGIGRLDDIPAGNAECLIAVCRSPIRSGAEALEDRAAAALAGIYAAALAEHRRMLLFRRRCHPLRRLLKAWRRRRGIL